MLIGGWSQLVGGANERVELQKLYTFVSLLAFFRLEMSFYDLAIQYYTNRAKKIRITRVIDY